MRQRGPVNSLTSAGPELGLASTWRVAYTSRTSGASISPPKPTTSTGSPRSCSACSSRAIWSRRRTRIAVDGGGSVAASRQWASTRSATQAASSSTVDNSAVSTWPPSWPPGSNSDTASPLERNGSEIALATVNTPGVLRHDTVSSLRVAGSPDSVGKSSRNLARVPALAPRHA
nr:hypothetical protein [Stackebrandtia endophytica]